MKTIFTITFIAQATTQTSLGVRGGTHIATQFMKGSEFKPESISGATVGVVLEIPILDKLFIQPEVVYLRKGFKSIEMTNLGDEFELKLQLDHVEVPLLLKYKAGKQVFQYYLAGGPTLGYASDGHIIAFGSVKERLGPKEWKSYVRREVGCSVGADLRRAVSSLGCFWMCDTCLASTTWPKKRT